MPRPGPTNLSRPAVLALAMLSWFTVPGAVGSARASACHLPERPALGIDPPGDSSRHVAAWEMLGASETAPPVVRHVPCPGESARTTAVAMFSAVLSGLGTFANPPDIAPRSRLVPDDIDRLDPHPFRLDRPPR